MSTSEVAQDYDAVVVGAGPAGSAAATHLLLGAPNLKVAIIDKAQFPRDKACGDGLGPGVVSQLELLGVDVTAIPSAQIIDTAEVHGANNLTFSTRIADFDQRASYGLTAPRVDFDDLLRRRAIACGALYMDETRFVDSSSKRGVIKIDIQSGTKRIKRSLTCRLLIGADGASSRVRRAIGVTPNSAKRTGIAVRAYADLDVAYSDRIFISFEETLRPGYGWCFPFSDGTANVGVGMVISDYRRRRPKLDALLDDYISTLSHRGISVSRTRSYSTHILPHGGTLPRLTAEGTALVGDAGSMINPLSGEGIVYGLRAARILSDVTLPALLAGECLGPALSEYDRLVRSEFSRHLRSNYIAHRMLRNRWWSRFILGAAANDTHLQKLAVDLMFGDGHITAAGVGRVIVSGAIGVARS